MHELLQSVGCDITGTGYWILEHPCSLQIFLLPATAAGELFCPPAPLRSCPTGTFESIVLKQKNKAPVADRLRGS